MMNSKPTTEDRVWAVLAHLSALSFGMGILLPVVGWSDQRRKSNYASFQCLQALGYQSVGFTVWVLSSLLIIVVASLLFLATSGPVDGESQTANAALSPVVLVFLILFFGFFALYFVLPIIAAIACALGKDFRYPLMGNRLAHYLGYDPSQGSEDQARLNENHEFRWVAAMGHFSILIMLWGMLAPLTAWILQGKHSAFLRFQSAQTLVYQGVTTIIYFIGGFLYLVGIVLLVTSMGGIGGPDFNSATGIISLVVTGVALLIAAVLILLVPLLHILGQWAGYRVLKGENYHYPLIGRLVEKRLSAGTLNEEKPV
jgi:uncharacterized Tic20 family protein